MTNEEAISVIENEIQIDVRLCTDEQVDRFQTALYMAISALRAEHAGDPLTLEQLRKMDGQPVYCVERKEWGIIHIDPDGMWANIPFFRGVYCDLDVKHNGLTLYAYQPAHIGREAWVSVEERLPDDNERVIAYRPNEADVSVYKYCVMWGWSVKMSMKHRGISHWMPLPEPPIELEKKMGVRV